LGDPYCFDKDIQVIHKDGISTNFADFSKGAIAENLERLEWFGVLICREAGRIKRWQFADPSSQAA
jgi:hypothetical protein